MIRVVIVGAGFMGKTHAKAYQKNEDATVVAVCDPNKVNGLAFANELGCVWNPDLETILNQIDCDVVDVCIPTFLHEKAVVLAAQFHKHVICEKPVALSSKSVMNMVSAARKNHVHLYVGQVLRFWSEYAYAKRLVDQGALGEIKAVYAARLSEHPAWSTWYRRAENSGGGLFDLHLHDIDYMVYLFGQVKKVYARGVKNHDGCWNHVSTLLSFAHGFVVTVEGMIEMPQGYPFTMRLRITGDKKCFEYEMIAGQNLERIDSAKRQSRLIGDHQNELVSIDEVDAYQVELDHFIACIKMAKESPVIPVDSVLHVMDVMCAIERSLEMRKEVAVS